MAHVKNVSVVTFINIDIQRRKENVVIKKYPEMKIRIKCRLPKSVFYYPKMSCPILLLKEYLTDINRTAAT